MSLAGKVKTATTAKPAKKNALVTTEALPESSPDDLANDEEFLKLDRASQKAIKEKPIEATRKLKIENERKILELKKEAGEVMTYQEGKFLFFGFFDKASRDWQRVGKRNKPILKNLVQEGDLDGVIKLYDEEITTIIKGLKREQKKVVDTWKRELKG